MWNPRLREYQCSALPHQQVVDQGCPKFLPGGPHVVFQTLKYLFFLTLI